MSQRYFEAAWKPRDRGGAVRVIPQNAEFVDVQILRKIGESTGAKLAFQVTVKASTGRIWSNIRHYESQADAGSYATDAALKARDPFQNVYSQIARTAGAIGGTVSLLSGLKKYADAKTHTQALKKLADSFQNEVALQVVDVEGRTLRRTGTTEERYREWRKLLHQMYVEES